MPHQHARPRAEQERRARHKDHQGGVHRVPYVVVRSRGDHPVPALLLNAHDRGQVGILPKRQEQEDKRAGQDERAGDLEPERHRRPMQARRVERQEA